MPDVGAIRMRCSRFKIRCRTGWLFLIMATLITAGCATTPPTSELIPVAAGISRSEQVLRTEIQPWLGTPYRMGGMSRRGIDCSGLVVIVFDDLFGLRLPRTTTALIRSGRRVEKSQLAAGDLLFFKPRSKVYHVGIYLGHGEFVHASASSGVMVSRINDDYWRRRYLTGRRLL